MATFLLELGFEELPSRFLPLIEDELKSRFSVALHEEFLAFSEIKVCTTPRRAVVLVQALDSAQAVREEEVLGPPARIAFDAEGKPTKAAEGFAKNSGVSLDQVYRVSTEKGEYVALRKKTGGEQAEAVLSRVCPAIIATLSFPKRMRWGSGDFSFARPLRWIVAMLDAAPLLFVVGGLESGSISYGHRIHGYGPFTIPSASAYETFIQEKGSIVLEGAIRRARIVEQGNMLAHKAGGRVLWSDSLLDEVCGLTEHPVPLLGDFDPVYLELPREVLLTSMQSHQKSFGIEKTDGTLLPHFLTVLNTTPPDMILVKKGWERVLRARLEDARFFWKSDLENSFDSWCSALDTVTFLAPLGSMGEKTRRLAKLCVWLSQQTGIATTDSAHRAGLLSKADLVSGMVGEFATLQGVMGGIYARKKGEDEAVATALAEQYLPAGPDSPIPSSALGSLLSIADKADTLVGCFGLGMIPTGAADPYALRRCALGIARILLENKLRIDIKALFAEAFAAYGERSWEFSGETLFTKLEDFFSTRVKNMLLGGEADTLCVEAIVAADACDVWAASQRLNALATVMKKPEFELAVQTLKRVTNIVRKYPQFETLTGQWQKELLQEAAEQQLAMALEEFQTQFDTLFAGDRFEELFAQVGALRPAVDLFFEKTMVMSEDEALRCNRLNLLAAIVHKCSKLADFTALQR